MLKVMGEKHTGLSTYRRNVTVTNRSSWLKWTQQRRCDDTRANRNCSRFCAVRPAAARPLATVSAVVPERVDSRVPATAAGTGGSSAVAVAQQRRRRRHVLRSASAATAEAAGAHAAPSSTAATTQATQAVAQRRFAVEWGVRGRLTYRHWEKEAHEAVPIVSTSLEQHPGPIASRESLEIERCGNWNGQRRRNLEHFFTPWTPNLWSRVARAHDVTSCESRTIYWSLLKYLRHYSENRSRLRSMISLFFS